LEEPLNPLRGTWRGLHFYQISISIYLLGEIKTEKVLVVLTISNGSNKLTISLEENKIQGGKDLRDYRLTEHSRQVTCNGIFFIGSINNGSFVGLDHKAEKFVHETLKGHIPKSNELSEENKEIIDTLKSFNILECASALNEIVTSSMPHTAYLHITNRCNFSCYGCYSSNSSRNVKADLSPIEIKKILKNIKNLGIKNILISGGEPFIYQDLKEVLRYAKEEASFERIVIGTNGSLCTQEALRNISQYVDGLVIAIDGFNIQNQTYLRDRGSYQKSITAIENAILMGLNTTMLPTLHRSNFKKLRDYKFLADNLGSHLAFSLLTPSKRDFDLDGIVLSNDDFFDLVESMAETDQVAINDLPADVTNLAFKENCGAGTRLISIDPQGDIFPCHMLHNDELYMGNALEISEDEFRSRQQTINQYLVRVEEREGCVDCGYRYFCGGGCFARSYFTSGSYKVKAPYCDGYRKVFSNYCNALNNPH